MKNFQEKCLQIKNAMVLNPMREKGAREKKKQILLGNPLERNHWKFYTAKNPTWVVGILGET